MFVFHMFALYCFYTAVIEGHFRVLSTELVRTAIQNIYQVLADKKVKAQREMRTVEENSPPKAVRNSTLLIKLRPNFNTREFNTSEIGRLFGHNLLPRRN